MAKSKDHDNEPKDKYEPHRKHDGGDRPYQREETGDDPSRHASIIERRWQGSLPPTADRYAKAIQQWQKLPGSVSRPATDAPSPDEKPANTNPAGKESES